MKILLIILDGFGLKRKSSTVNKKHCPFLFKLMKKFPTVMLHASGKHVGLPHNVMGNSEVGHRTIGSGEITPQPSLFITESRLQNFFSSYVIPHKKIAIIALVSDGNIHASIDHIIYIHKIFYAHKEIDLHFISDGRDTEKKIAKKFIEKLKICKIEIASICGRYYAMDRNGNMDRTTSYFNTITKEGSTDRSIHDAVDSFYAQNITDEFFPPTLLKKNRYIDSSSFIIFGNFRADRMIQLFSLFGNKSLTMVPYGDNENFIFPTINPKITLGKILSENNLRDGRFAESEKEKHITYFLNGNLNNSFFMQKNFIIKSHKNIEPKMQVKNLRKKIQEQISNFDFIALNIANGDMIGHLGDIDMSIATLPILDHEVRQIFYTAQKNDFLLLISADHGNIEEPEHKKHTTNKIPFIVCSEKYVINKSIRNPSLRHILPTLCYILDLKYFDAEDSLVKK